MLHEFEVRKIIEGILADNEVECDVEYVPTGFYVPMSYSPKQRTIRFNHYNLYGKHQKHFKKIDLSHFARVITYHELGHLLDIEANGYADRSVYEIELSAWNEAEKVIPLEIATDFKLVKDMHVEYHKRKANK